ncbi:hypothetical protein INR49_026100 [Caranx melampygus]|nr:hypothetical protein INR49_026100 [Caranx melampygus]
MSDPSKAFKKVVCPCGWMLIPHGTHTPDNSFLGFVVEQHLNASDIRHIDDIKRQNQSLVYGKVDNFWKPVSPPPLMLIPQPSPPPAASSHSLSCFLSLPGFTNSL